MNFFTLVNVSVPARCSGRGELAPGIVSSHYMPSNLAQAATLVHNLVLTSTYIYFLLYRWYMGVMPTLLCYRRSIGDPIGCSLNLILFSCTTSMHHWMRREACCPVYPRTGGNGHVQSLNTNFSRCVSLVTEDSQRWHFWVVYWWCCGVDLVAWHFQSEILKPILWINEDLRH